MSKKPVLGMILKGYPRISETFISNEILLLEKMGFRIHIISMRQPREPFCHDSVKKIQAPVDYLPETLLAPLPRFLYHNFLLAVTWPRKYAKALKTAVRRFGRTRKPATLKHLFQAGYLVHKYLPNSGIKHLHAHFAHSPTSVAMFASHLSGLPFSFTAHAKDIYTSDVRQLAEKISQARFVVTCTEYNRKHLKNLAKKNSLTSATPIYRIYHGIDMELFSLKDTTYPRKSPSSPFEILTVARISPKKGLPTVYQALRKLLDQGVAFRHTLIGDGDDRDKIRSLISKLGLKKFTRQLGTQPHDVVLDWYKKADLFVLGCQVAENGDRDGIPNVFIESMAMGVPVVATRISAIPELIKNEETGLLVSPGDPGALAAAMLQALTDQNLRELIIQGGKKYVKEFFDNRRLIRNLGGVFRSNTKGNENLFLHTF